MLDQKPLAGRAHYTTQILKPSEITPALVSAWQNLEARAIVPNAFLSPHFVLPALQHLESPGNVFGVFVQKTSAGLSELVGVALFKMCGPTRRFPLEHLCAFETIHSYLTDFLLDREHASSALREIFRYLSTQRYRWHGLHLNNLSTEYLLTEEAQAVTSELGARWTVFEQWSRAILSNNEFGEASLAQVSKRRIKTQQKNMKKLEELGKLEWVFTRQTDSPQTLAEEFVRLEHSGWKGAAGTSLYSNPNQLRFFYETVTNFNRTGQFFFTELRLNQTSIALTTNFISGKAAFGFKVGWDAAYAQFGLGIMNELETVKHAAEVLSDLEYIDSAAAPDSYINELWPGKRAICEGMFSLSPIGRVALASTGIARKLKIAVFPRRDKTSDKRSQNSAM
jgi:hypothetical protein